jgi:hypothetical protein
LRLDQVPLLRAPVRDEQAAMRALEALVAIGATLKELCLEALVAMWADDPVLRVGLGAPSHLREDSHVTLCP